METSSQNTEANTSIDVIESQIRELFGRTAYSHKTHEKGADRYTQRLRRIRIWQIVLSAVTTGTLLVALFGQGKAATLIATVFSTLLLILSTYSKDTDLVAIAKQHSETASELWDARESYLSILTDIAAGQISMKHVREQRDMLQTRLKGIYQRAPRTDNKAYGMAQKALKDNEDLTFSDDEIDNFLPGPLKKVSANSKRPPEK
jgi:hypothetical protein